MFAATSTILLCTDDPSLRLLLRLAIEPRGHRVVEAGDGEAAIALSQSTEPNLVIVDLLLPDCSGVDVVRVLREHPKLSGTPILMAMGRSHPSDRMAAEAAGVDSFICKPFGITWLVDEIERLLVGSVESTVSLPLHRLR